LLQNYKFLLNWFSKAKEIGIRKINGTRISELMAMLNLGFVKWVAIAFLVVPFFPNITQPTKIEFQC
jgi:hypothetical protein